jgi:hypothetical protein
MKNRCENLMKQSLKKVIFIKIDKNILFVSGWHSVGSLYDHHTAAHHCNSSFQGENMLLIMTPVVFKVGISSLHQSSSRWEYAAQHYASCLQGENRLLIITPIVFKVRICCSSLRQLSSRWEYVAHHYVSRLQGENMLLIIMSVVFKVRTWCSSLRQSSLRWEYAAHNYASHLQGENMLLIITPVVFKVRSQINKLIFITNLLFTIPSVLFRRDYVLLNKKLLSATILILDS